MQGSESAAQKPHGVSSNSEGLCPPTLVKARKRFLPLGLCPIPMQPLQVGRLARPS